MLRSYSIQGHIYVVFLNEKNEEKYYFSFLIYDEIVNQPKNYVHHPFHQQFLHSFWTLFCFCSENSLIFIRFSFSVVLSRSIFSCEWTVCFFIFLQNKKMYFGFCWAWRNNVAEIRFICHVDYYIKWIITFHF